MTTPHLTRVAGLFCLAAGAASAQTPTLTVYTYDSFVAEWGPGPQIEAAFEEVCGCDLQFVGAGDGAALLSRLMLEGSRTDADVLLGIDTNLVATARDAELFAPHGVEAELDLPITWEDETFLPYDWGYFAFVGNVSDAAPANFRELAASDLGIAIQDPRSSTPGLGLLLWVDQAYGDEAGEIWEGLSDNIVTVTPGWSEAYGLFTSGEVDAVLSYTTSPAYHRIAEGDDTKVAWTFDEGHYMQIEVAAQLASSDEPELAAEFMAFIATDAFQSVIPTTNWMYPSKMPEGGLPDGFTTPADPTRALIYDAETAVAVRDAAIEVWRRALSQ